jgi:hypothetical protein
MYKQIIVDTEPYLHKYKLHVIFNKKIKNKKISQIIKVLN